jgi:hypothetical protein
MERYDALMALYEEKWRYHQAVYFGPDRDRSLAPEELQEALDLLWGQVMPDLPAAPE